MPPLTFDKIITGLATLPQELHDEIFSLVLTPSSSAVNIKRTYKPPRQLQLSRATRDLAARRYYTNTIFQLAQGGSREDAWWLASLTQEHVDMVRTYYKTKSRVPVEDSWDRACTDAYEEVGALRGTAALERRVNVSFWSLFTNVEYLDDDEVVKVVWEDCDFLFDKWYKAGMPTIVRLGPDFVLGAYKNNVRDRDEDRQDGQVDGDDDDGGVREGGEEKHESDDEDEQVGTSRFASSNPFGLLAD